MCNKEGESRGNHVAFHILQTGDSTTGVEFRFPWGSEKSLRVWVLITSLNTCRILNYAISKKGSLKHFCSIRWKISPILINQQFSHKMGIRDSVWV